MAEKTGVKIKESTGYIHEVLSVAEFTESGMAVVRQIRGGGDAELVPNRLELQLGKVKNS